MSGGTPWPRFTTCPAAAAPAASRRIHAPSSWPRAGMVALICAVVVTTIVLAFTWPTKTQEAKELREARTGEIAPITEEIIDDGAGDL